MKMTNKNTGRWLVGLVALQVGFLLAWAGWHEGVRSSGETVRLATRPVDPRDILRGDYMIMNYAISVHEAEEWARTGMTVAVVLKPEGELHVIDEVLAEAPGRGDGRLWAWARVGRMWGEVMQLNYGIERFFVPEGKGEPTFRVMEVDVAVSRAGRLQIVQVWLDGERYP